MNQTDSLLYELIHLSHYWLGNYEYLLIIDAGRPHVVAFSIDNGEARHGHLLSPLAMTVHVRDEIVGTLQQLIASGELRLPVIWCCDDSRILEQAFEPRAMAMLRPLKASMFEAASTTGITAHMFDEAKQFAEEHHRARGLQMPLGLRPASRRTVSPPSFADAPV